MKTGLVHIYTGDGKGKTTACAGLALRMAGSGGKVLYAFMQKGVMSSEIKVLKGLDNIDVLQVCTMTKFTHLMNEKERSEYNRQHMEGMKEIISLCSGGRYDMVVIDELLGALKEKAVDVSLVGELLDKRPPSCELVFSGRNAPGFLIDRADYVSEIAGIKHPYENGVPARKGIEF